MRAQVMAMDNIWDNPVITHGAIGWHNGQGGWRGGYCFVNAGWSDRIKLIFKIILQDRRKIQEEYGHIHLTTDAII